MRREDITDAMRVTYEISPDGGNAGLLRFIKAVIATGAQVVRSTPGPPITALVKLAPSQAKDFLEVCQGSRRTPPFMKRHRPISALEDRLVRGRESRRPGPIDGEKP